MERSIIQDEAYLTDAMVDLGIDEMEREMQKESMERADTIYIGTLQEITNSPAEHWTGTISPVRRLKNDEVTHAELDQAAELLGGSFVSVTPGASKRCVDGRLIQGYVDKAVKWFKRALGPQIQGGTSGDATGRRLARGYEPGATYVADVEAAATAPSRFAPGDHEDNKAEHPRTGCGQVDGEDVRIDLYNNERGNTILDTLAALYEKAGLEVPHEAPERLQANAASIAKHKLEYFKDKHTVVGWLKRTYPGSVERLMDAHKEATVTLNFDPGTTFHRDHFNAQTKDNVHNFNLDVWAIMEEHGEDSYFVLADAVATLMMLTDGSLGVYARMPKAKAAEPLAA